MAYIEDSEFIKDTNYPFNGEFADVVITTIHKLR